MKSCVGMARNKVTEWNKLRKLPTHTTWEVMKHWKSQKNWKQSSWKTQWELQCVDFKREDKYFVRHTVLQAMTLVYFRLYQ